MSPDGTKKLLVLFFDRLPTRWLGGYGCDWCETPEFDKLMAESLVYDNAFCEMVGLDAEPWGEALLGQFEAAKIAFEEEFVPVSYVAGSLTTDEESEATEEDEILAETLEGMVEFFREEESGLFWIEFSTGLAERLADQQPDDREPASPDVATLIAQADFLVGMIRETLRQNDLEETVSIILTSGEGCPLPDQKAGDLLSSNTHIPLLIRMPETLECERRAQLCSERDIPATIAEWFGLEKSNPGLAKTFASDLEPIHDYLWQVGDRACAIRHADWLFIHSVDVKDRLYEKPADRFEVNDMAGKFVDWCEAAAKFVEEVKRTGEKKLLPNELREIRFVQTPE